LAASIFPTSYNWELVLQNGVIVPHSDVFAPHFAPQFLGISQQLSEQKIMNGIALGVLPGH
jgi:hypothetical protein